MFRVCKENEHFFREAYVAFPCAALVGCTFLDNVPFDGEVGSSVLEIPNIFRETSS